MNCLLVSPRSPRGKHWLSKVNIYCAWGRYFNRPGTAGPWLDLCHFLEPVSMLFSSWVLCCSPPVNPEEHVWLPGVAFFGICHLHSQNSHPIALYVMCKPCYHWLWAQNGKYVCTIRLEQDGYKLHPSWLCKLGISWESSVAPWRFSRYVSVIPVRRFNLLKNQLEMMAVLVWMIPNLSVSSKSSICLLSISNRCHREADDVTRGRCCMLQLPEYNDPALNVIILTLCGISLSISLQCRCTAVYLTYICLGRVKRFYHQCVNPRLSAIILCVVGIMKARLAAREAKRVISQSK